MKFVVQLLNTFAGKAATLLGYWLKIKTYSMCSHVIFVDLFKFQVENANGDGFIQFLIDIQISYHFDLRFDFECVQIKKVTKNIGGGTQQLWQLIHYLYFP